MTTYSTPITREQGGSILNFGYGASKAQARFLTGASLILDSGASEHVFGTVTLAATGALTNTAGASITHTVTTQDQGTFALSDATRTATIGVGRNIPTHTASPGSLYIRSDGSMSRLYYNTSDGTTGSVWKAGGSQN